MARRVAFERLLTSRLKMRQLALVVALHDRRSLRQAAAEIAISQPAATKMLQEIEQAFGVALFERHGWGMAPTLYGDTLARYARAILNGVREAGEEVAALASGARGKLRVGSVTGGVPTLLVPALRALNVSAPQLQVFVLVNASEVLASALRDGTLDVAVGPPLAPALASGIVSEALHRESLCIVARPEHPLAGMRSLRWRDIDGASWILQPQGSALRGSIDALFTRAHIRPGVAVIETVSIVATLSLLQAFDALSVLPLDLARHYESRRMLVRLALPAPGATEYVVMVPAERELSPSAAAFVKGLRSVVSASHARGAAHAT